MSGQVKARWGELTDEEIDQVDGNSEKLEGKLQERYGIAREEAKKQVHNWFDSMKD